MKNERNQKNKITFCGSAASMRCSVCERARHGAFVSSPLVDSTRARVQVCECRREAILVVVIVSCTIRSHRSVITYFIIACFIGCFQPLGMIFGRNLISLHTHTQVEKWLMRAGCSYRHTLTHTEDLKYNSGGKSVIDRRHDTRIRTRTLVYVCRSVHLHR